MHFGVFWLVVCCHMWITAKLKSSLWRSSALPKFRGKMLSALAHVIFSPENPSVLPTVPGAVTSSWAGSGFSFRISPPADVSGIEFDLELAGWGGGGGLEGWTKAKGGRLTRVDDGDEEVGSGERRGPGEDGGGLLRGLSGSAQGRPRLVMTSLRVSIGEPLTDHSVMPIWRKWDLAWLDKPFRFSKYSPQNSQPISLGGSSEGLKKKKEKKERIIGQ